MQSLIFKERSVIKSKKMNKEHINRKQRETLYFSNWNTFSYPGIIWLKSQETRLRRFSLLTMPWWRVWWLILCVNMRGPLCPTTWSNILLGESVRVFLDEIEHLNPADWVKHIILLSGGGQLKTLIEQKGWVRLYFNCLSCTAGLPMDWNMYHQLSWVSGLLTEYLGPLQPSWSVEQISYDKLPIYR